MTSAGSRILAHLQGVADERAARSADASLRERVVAIKSYQQQRFRKTYADLLADARFGPAALFFLDELYGPDDFSERDAQFMRIVPALVRLFPEEIVRTVETLAALHALSERLDTQMARSLSRLPVQPIDYIRAWQATGQPDARRRQIDLIHDIGRALDRHTRNPVLRHSLRLMRGPAKAAGLAALQSFLERGFDTFREMRGAEPFLSIVDGREESLREALFAVDVEGVAAGALPSGLDRGSPLGQLP
jgi:hypothetical protein